MKNFTSKNLYDAKGIGNAGQEIRKMGLLFIDCNSEPFLCDMCDEKKPCAYINDVMHQNVSVIYVDCLKLIVKEFENESML